MKSSIIVAVCVVLNHCVVWAQGEMWHIDSNKATCISQSVIDCIYNYTTVTPVDSSVTASNSYETPVFSQKGIVENYQTILQAGSSVSKFRDYHSFKKDSMIFTSSKSLLLSDVDRIKYTYYTMVTHFFTPTIFKNYPQGKMTTTDDLALDEFIYEEPKKRYDWELVNDTLTICGYVCQQAKTKIGGRLWYVWFTSEIPISDGPWKLYGLPGLILKAVDGSGIHSFEAVEIRKKNNPIYLEKNILLVKTTKSEFLSKKHRFDSDEMPANLISGDQVKYVEQTFTGPYFINGKRVKKVRTTRYEPLEF